MAIFSGRKGKQGSREWWICAAIIISKDDRTAEVIAYFYPVGENCGRNSSFKFKVKV